MLEDFENLATVEEMFEYLAENKEGAMPETTLDLVQELSILQIQAFIKLFGKCKTLSDEQKDELEKCVDMYNDTENNVLLRQTALAHVCELLLPDIEGKKKDGMSVVRKNDSKVYQTPCEDCTSIPTHLVEFREGNRTEEHFLCEDCEKNAQAEEDNE